MTTARDIIEGALRKISVLGRGQTLSADEAQNALGTLNDLLSSWSVEGGLVYTDTQETFPLTSSPSYTMGSGSEFDTVVPYEINNAYVTSGGLDYYLTEIGRDNYDSISLKDTGAIPDCFYFDYGYPAAQLYLYPAPTSGYTITINSKKRLDEFSGLSADIALPPEYKRALVYNLAIEIAPEHEKEPSPTIKKIAQQSKNNVMAANTRNDENVMTSDYTGAPRNGNWNIYKGTNV